MKADISQLDSIESFYGDFSEDYSEGTDEDYLELPEQEKDEKWQLTKRLIDELINESHERENN